MCDARHPPEFGLSATVSCDKKLAFLSTMWHEVTELFESQKRCDSRTPNCSPYRQAAYE